MMIIIIVIIIEKCRRKLSKMALYYIFHKKFDIIEITCILLLVFTI